MERIEVLRIKKATEAILGSSEIKASLDFKQIYALSKLNRKSSAINDKTKERDTDLRKAFELATSEETKRNACALPDEEALKKILETDIKNLYNENVDFDIEVRIPAEKAEKILQLLPFYDLTNTVVEYLLEAPEGPTVEEAKKSRKKKELTK